MGDQESSSTLPPTSSTLVGPPTELALPTTLKFIISNIKNLISNTLTADNYAIWRTQIFQHLSANGYADHLTGKTLPPLDPASSAHAQWRLVDNNLISALFSTISPAILPYIITSATAHEIWAVLECWLQSSSRSRIIQLKNELHHIQMNNQTMQQYLAQVKNIIDNIAASGTKIDPKEIIFYILNGLPATYNSFKTYIRSSSLPADLDASYSLLCSEEIHINQDIKKDQLATTTAYYATSYNQMRNKNTKRPNKF
ncbi:uncharacterized protein LOC110097312 [Dendrobium catenatum]|uniref:uncharacterized protein LOC110097312 n=1 Tax=Dendrobium catenatum TaxID=906689 RepID=UPI0009F2384A|nr:uncharacterized protein LOC110097312 [Dendrobium catenatum]